MRNRAVAAGALIVAVASVAAWSLAYPRGSLSATLVRAVADCAAVATLVCVTTLLVGGVTGAAVALTSPTELYTTGYGRVLTAKVAVTAVLIVLAWRNRTMWLPAARSHRATAVVSRSRSRTELAIMAVALALGAALAVTGWRRMPPGMMGTTAGRTKRARRSSDMAEQRDRPDETPGAASPAAGSGSSAKKAPARLADTNGDLTSAAKETAAHAKSAVASASNPVSGPIPVPLDGPAPSRLPLAAAIAAGVLAVLMVLFARRQAGDD